MKRSVPSPSLASCRITCIRVCGKHSRYPCARSRAATFRYRDPRRRPMVLQFPRSATFPVSGTGTNRPREIAASKYSLQINSGNARGSWISMIAKYAPSRPREVRLGKRESTRNICFEALSCSKRFAFDISQVPTGVTRNPIWIALRGKRVSLWRMLRRDKRHAGGLLSR
jgi:hypothetical protein